MLATIKLKSGDIKLISNVIEIRSDEIYDNSICLVRIDRDPDSSPFIYIPTDDIQSFRIEE